MTLTERKTKVAKENREDLIATIKDILKSMESNMPLKDAMNCFLSARTKEPENYVIFKANGIQKLRKDAAKFVKKADKLMFLSDASKRQMPSSWR